jgi:fumarate hydratase, class II
VVEAKNRFESQGARLGTVEASGAVRSIALALGKIANDIRWLSSGPRFGLGELRIPSVQPGSSIMPGKVNPVMAEALLQVVAQVIGHDAAIAWGQQGSQMELNTMMPLIAWNLLESVRLLTTASSLFAKRCVSGICLVKGGLGERVERSLALATGLVPVLGYEEAAHVASVAHDKGITVREAAKQLTTIASDELDRLLDVSRMLDPVDDE